MIATLHRVGLKVWVWTVNAPRIMQCLIDWNIDAIASDRPDILKSARAPQVERSEIPKGVYPAGVTGCRRALRIGIQGKPTKTIPL